MVGVTERAKGELKKLLSDKVDMPQAGLRLVDRGQGRMGLGIDVERSGDDTVEFEGAKILMVEHELANRLAGITIDVEDTEAGAKLVLVEQR